VTTTEPPAFGAWWKSSYSNGGDNCVEIAVSSDGRVGLRDTKDRTLAPHVFTRGAWAAFLAGARDGEFDLPPAD
jgi:hypothetical protein